MRDVPHAFYEDVETPGQFLLIAGNPNGTPRTVSFLVDADDYATMTALGYEAILGGAVLATGRRLSITVTVPAYDFASIDLAPTSCTSRAFGTKRSRCPHQEASQPAGGVRGVTITAARLLALRRTSGSGAKITKLLKSPRSQVRDAAIGALIELKDQRAVRALIESAPSDDPDAQPRIVEALGAIGGTESAAYLELLAAGTDEPQLREAAARARARIR